MNTDKIYAESVAKEYAPNDTSKIVALRKLDRKAKLRSIIFGYTFGSIMALMLGIGMCLCMNVLSIGSYSFILGIIIGVIGIAGVSANPLICKRLLEEDKKKYGSDIIELARQISEAE